MSIDFNQTKCQTHTAEKKFGICDDSSKPKDPAYIDTKNGKIWIAVVINKKMFKVTFTVIDNCIEIKRADGKMEKRCDGMLTFNSTVIFTELKVRAAAGNARVKDGEQQLRASIAYFKTTNGEEAFTKKMAYIANREPHPKAVK